MKALISTIENSYDYQGNVLGFRVAQLSDTEFEVASSLFWIECSIPNCLPDDIYYLDGQIYLKPVKPEPTNLEIQANTGSDPIV